MTRALGGFADRGVHTLRGGVPTIIETPSLALMCCRWCRKAGVTVTALRGGQIIGWCTMQHSSLGGLVQPPGNVPSPPRSRRKAV